MSESASRPVLEAMRLLGATVVLVLSACAWAEAVSWKQALDQPAEWYRSNEAAQMADRVLLHQRSNGGWDKRIDYAQPLSPEEKAEVAREKESTSTTIDNHATTTELRFLARMVEATGESRYREAFDRGLQWLLDAQYPNGGWPQYYPLREGYYSHITFNDDAMARVLGLMQRVASGESPYGFASPEQRAAARRAFERGVECVLATQVVIDGRPTVWCAQHDVDTFEPAQARVYEHPSLTAMESVPVVRVLMSIEDPSREIMAAVEGAVRWFDQVKLEGIEMIDTQTPDGQRDRKVVRDPEADPIWARFYEIGTNRPIFSGRDGVIRYDMSEIERERRAGYRWYTRRPLSLLREDYPAWRAKWTPGRDVLAE